MQSELDALKNNNTWILTNLPKAKKAIASNWVFRVKYNSYGIIDKYKVRLVTKRYSQLPGVDYHESFSLVAKLVTVRVFLAIAATKIWQVHQLDINKAYLHGHIEEDLYMQAPKGYTVPKGQVCKLVKSLYSLKQAGRQWNIELASKMCSYGFKQY